MTAPNWKKRQWRCKAYGKFVASLPCALTGHRATDWLGVDPHHEPRKGDHGTSSKCGDERQIPIRHDLHVKMESPGNSRKSVYAEYGVDVEAVISATQAEWVRRGGRREWESG